MALMRRVRVVWTGVAGSPAYSNFYSVSGTLTPTDVRAAVGNLIGTVNQWFVNDVTATVDTEVALIDSVTGDIQAIDNIGTILQFQGLQAGEMLPRATQVLTRWRTTEYINGKRVQGRTYWPYMAEVINVDGVVDQGFATALNAACTEYLGDMGGDAVVYAKTSGAAAQIDSSSTWGQFAMMRSRRD